MGLCASAGGESDPLVRYGYSESLRITGQFQKNETGACISSAVFNVTSIIGDHVYKCVGC